MALGIAHVALLVVLAVLIVQGDSPATTTAFWLTRPVGRKTMLASKAATAGLMLVALPAVANATAATANRLPWADVVGVAVFSAIDHAAVVLAAMAIAAATADLAAFALTAVGLFVAFEASLVITRLSPSFITGRGWLTARSTSLVAIALVAVAGLAVFTFQYLWRSRRLALAALAVVAAALPVHLSLWDIDLLSREPPLDTRVLRPDVVTVSVGETALRAWTSGSGEVNVGAYLAVTSPAPRVLFTPMAIEGRLAVAGNGTVRFEDGKHRRPPQLRHPAARFVGTRPSDDRGGTAAVGPRLELGTPTGGPLPHPADVARRGSAGAGDPGGRRVSR